MQIFSTYTKTQPSWGIFKELSFFQFPTQFFLKERNQVTVLDNNTYHLLTLSGHFNKTRKRVRDLDSGTETSIHTIPPLTPTLRTPCKIIAKIHSDTIDKPLEAFALQISGKHWGIFFHLGSTAADLS